MGNFIIILILVLLCVNGFWSYRKKLRYGCCGAGGDEEKKVSVRDKDLSHYPYQAVLTVEGMTCQNCRTRVENALNKQEGVWAQVDLKKKTAKVHMKALLTEEELRRIVTRAGYTVQSVSMERAASGR